MANVRLNGLKKVFGHNPPAVDIETLDITEGEFLTLLGPSGCGKSTLLRMIAGLEKPTAGEIRFDGKVVNALDPAERNIAMVFQNYALYPHMTVADNVGYPLKKRGVPKAERDARIAEIAALLKIDPLLDRRPRELSGGQQQRVALGRAMIRDPAVYLFDEPLSNLDASLRAHMRNELIRLRASVKGTMIFVTHDQVEAMTMSTRIAVMDAGEVQQLGTPDELYEEPANTFVASFVGTPSMNLVEARIEGAGTRLVTETFAADLPGGVLPDGPVTMGVRPEDILIGAGDIAGSATVVESLGNEQIVTVDVGGRELTARSTGDTKIRGGDAFRFGLRTARLHFFDPETGERMRPTSATAASPAASATMKEAV